MDRSLDRRSFISLSLGSLSAAAIPHLAAQQPPAAGAQHTTAPARAARPSVTPMLYGTPRRSTDLAAWFRSMQQWGVQQWMSFAVPLPTYWPGDGPSSKSVAFLRDAWPGFAPYLDDAALAAQEESTRNIAALCAAHGIEFWYMLPFPIFPTQDTAVVQKVMPDLFQSGRLNLYDPRLPDLLKANIRALKRSLPTLKGVNLWMSEGMGGPADVIGENIQHNGRWEEPLLRAFDEVTRELDIRGILFGHHYLQTVGSHRTVYQLMNQFPRLVIMDDITWPEEDLMHPFLGYLPPQDKHLLFRRNPVALNFLLDTEYVGEGILPSVYPRWWQHNVSESARHGVEIAMGRTFFWDNGLTDVNFNRLNAHMFTRFCHHPALDPRQALEDAAKEMFGPAISPQLVDILWHTEPVMQHVFGINGIDSFNHSRFPSAAYIDVVYTAKDNCMKAVDDLFTPPGTPLYPPLTDSLNNYKQWRWQDRTVSRGPDLELEEKRSAAQWIASILPQVREHAAALAPAHRDLFVNGYQLLDVVARGMQLFVEAAGLHYQWAHAKTIDDGPAKARFRDLATRLRTLAAQVPQNPFGYRPQMLAVADFLETKLPRIATPHP